MRVGAVRASLAAMVLSLGLIATAHAQAEAGKKPDFAAAKKHFKSGQALMQMERYGAAVEEFTKAYDITKDGLVMGQVALAYEKAGDYEAALEAARIYTEALARGEKANGQALIKKYEKLIKQGKSKKLVLPSEKAAMEAEKKRQQAAAAAESEDEDEELGLGTEEGKKGRFYTWIAAGAAGALALSALVVGLNAQSKYDELSERCKPGCSDDEVDSVKTRAIVTDVLWGTAAAAAATAVVLFFLEDSGGSEEREDPLYDEDDEDLVERINVTPVVGGGTYGLGAGIRF